MIIDWIFNINLIFTLVGISFFLRALFIVRKIIQLIPNRDIVGKWNVLFILIIFFIVMYIFNIYISQFHIIDLILFMLVYLFGAFFLYLIILRAYETYKQLNEHVKKQKDYIDQILKVSHFKTDFLLTMSHELRTPLNSIIGFTDLILEGTYGSLTEDQLNFLTDIKSSAVYQFDMIKNILIISEIEFGVITVNLQEFSLINILNQIKANFKIRIEEKGLKLVFQGVNDNIKIIADPIKFKDIMIELIDNAAKFTKKGEITVIFEESIDDWIFKIKDTGIGIAEKDFGIVFKDFSRSSDPFVLSTKGAGLGLSLAKRIINLHGGEINFDSIHGKGSTFSFNIPKKKSA